MKVTIDRENCIGCGVCASVCPEVFAIDDENLAYVIEQPAEITDAVQEAVDSCPTGVIQLEE